MLIFFKIHNISYQKAGISVFYENTIYIHVSMDAYQPYYISQNKVTCHVSNSKNFNLKYERRERKYAQF